MKTRTDLADGAAHTETPGARGADVRDLLSLRERTEELARTQATDAKHLIDVQRLAEEQRAKELAEARAIDREASALEVQNQQRLIRALTVDATAGITGYLLMDLLRAGKNERRSR
jgi:hypothetical protein